MEEAPLLSQEITKSETNQQSNNHRISSARGGGSNSTTQHHLDPLAAGQVSFRLLCNVHTAGGVIGNSGSIIKHLETLTGSKIRFEDGIPSCHERVINIIGDVALEKMISVAGGEADTMVSVSKAQEGLLRVFERVLELQGNAGSSENKDNNVHHCNGAITCRLLAPMDRIGALMGKGGKIVDGIRKSTGAKIRVLKEDQVPACAGPEEELIQIFGGVLAVKKALLAISRRLQDRNLGGRGTGHMSAHDLKRILHIDEDSSSMRKVLFRFLCSSGIAGGVIGRAANIVKCLESETGASIKFASPVSGSKERLAIISSLESPDPLYSPAQVAIVRVFSRCMEVALDHGIVSSLGNGVSVSARILVASNQVSSMLDENGRVALDISIASGAEIKLTGADDLPSCAGVNDNVVQISGDYENVKSALFQLAGKLRENFFSGTGPRGTGCIHSSYSAIPSNGPNGREAASSIHLVQQYKLSDIDKLEHLGFVQKPSSPDLPGLGFEHSDIRESLPRPVGSAQGMTHSHGGLKHESYISNEGSKQKVEVLVAKEAFASVYGENGSNLARLREISGATVTPEDPCPGESSGKVIICGTLERIQIAQTLLQAFISF